MPPEVQVSLEDALGWDFLTGMGTREGRSGPGARWTGAACRPGLGCGREELGAPLTYETPSCQTDHGTWMQGCWPGPALREVNVRFKGTVRRQGADGTTETHRGCSGAGIPARGSRAAEGGLPSLTQAPTHSQPLPQECTRDHLSAWKSLSVSKADPGEDMDVAGTPKTFLSGLSGCPQWTFQDNGPE